MKRDIRCFAVFAAGLKMHTLESSIKQLADKGILSPSIASRYLHGGQRPGS